MSNKKRSPRKSAGLNSAVQKKSGPVELRLDPERILRALLVIVALMVAASLTAHVIRFGLGHPHALGLVRLFDLNQEANVPTWFSSILLASCSGLLALTAIFKRSTGDPWCRHWAVLAGVFLAMSLDEAASIHELTMKPLRETFGLGGLLTNAWVLLAFLLIPVFVVVFMRFFLNLPSRSQKLLALSGSIYLVGVVGIEMFSGLIKSTYGNQHLWFALMTTLEETVEMLGLALIIYSLADYMARSGIELRLGLVSRQRSASGRGAEPHNYKHLRSPTPT